MTDYHETDTLGPRPVPTAFVPFCTDAIPEPIQSYIRGGARAMTCAALGKADHPAEASGGIGK